MSFEKVYTYPFCAWKMNRYHFFVQKRIELYIYQPLIGRKKGVKLPIFIQQIIYRWGYTTCGTDKKPFLFYIYHYPAFLFQYELGEILNFCLLGMLKSSNCTPGQKVDLIEALGLVFSTPQSVVDLFYNFDNDYHSSNLLDG